MTEVPGLVHSLRDPFANIICVTEKKTSDGRALTVNGFVSLCRQSG